MARRLILTAHWSDAEDGIDRATAAMRPLKAEGTVGWAGAYDDLEYAEELYAALFDTADEEHEALP